MTVPTIGHNNPPADYSAIITANAPDAVRDMLRGGIRLRLLATALLNRCVTDKAALEAEKVNLYRLAGIADGRKRLGDKPVKAAVSGTDYAVTASLHPVEIAKVKAAFSNMFSDVAFFVGELLAESVADDVTAIREPILTGGMALSTAKRTINAARTKADKAADDAAAAAAEATLTDGTGPEMLAPETAPVASFASAVLALAERIAALTVPFDAETETALAMLDEVLCERAAAHAEATADLPESIAA